MIIAGGEWIFHYRAHFSYHPDDDLYIPCHELGISFVRGDILHIINNEDPHWWQAYRDGEWTQTLAGLIPSMALQQHRMALQRQKREQDLKEAREAEKSPLRKKAGSGGTACGTGSSSLLCAKKSNKRKRTNSPFEKGYYFNTP
ncbi:MPP5 [Lepeophtheirus salmonis]|uniref:MPP5 n=1 Tax=Lepeophtheirus salmonis TaxID=72036 RepID=A0A7R8H5I8_LEPSM|nr:MPP5 [Lepeophtheirus salmonis]CAF2881181.1 MPP5 [Lepeophtheirus salmonis]